MQEMYPSAIKSDYIYPSLYNEAVATESCDNGFMCLTKFNMGGVDA